MDTSLLTNRPEIVQHSGGYDRRQRIKAYSVDRSIFLRYPLPSWSPEAQAREPEWEAIRMKTTAAERMDAWRGLFSIPNSVIVTKQGAVVIELNVILVSGGNPVGGAVVRIDTLPNLAIFPPTRMVNAGGPGTCNFYVGPPLVQAVQVAVSVDAAGYVPWTTSDTNVVFQNDTVNLEVELVPFQ